MRRYRACGILAALLAVATAAPAAAREPSGASPLAGTIATESYRDLERKVSHGAIALWALGAIEEHGPHLPLMTDVVVPSGQLRIAAGALERRGVPSVIVPPYYWGVNNVTGAFAGSISIRPEVMTELMLDVFRSMAKAGIKRIYCITGHFDAAHAGTIAAAVKRANDEKIIEARFVVPAPLGKRLGLVSGQSGAIFAEWPAPPAGEPDLHAGEMETSAMLDLAPELVQRDIASTLPPTGLTPEQLAGWRKGGDTARSITPSGYLGRPADATAAKGSARLALEAGAYADAISADLKAVDGSSGN
ncbi:creatininase family protein [Sphingomonas sp. So64.6b]|uniref:creatininase family protein n=1 Tax=Sphingomonas sp. So64.6b TaxID=2997354 RepID=UPI001602DE97|nr:creatininase family protein [Sphingomonas sp. So64.6b]QNA82894.1 creatininase family protein [Sphingomonas sp. So64.6b]